MVRVLALILPFFTVMSAFANEKKIDSLAKVARESTDLESVHVALNELYQMAISSSVDAELKSEAGGTLSVLANESAARIQASQKPERTAEDLLTLHMANLGHTEKSKVLDIENMIALGTDRMKIAATIFLRDHFSAEDPRAGFFPVRPESLETNMVNWQTDGMESVIRMMPVVLAKISYNSSLNRGTKLGEISAATYTQIAKTLYDAAHDVKPDPKATKEALAIRMFRQRLAAHWLDELSKTLLVWRQVRFPNPEVKPGQKPDNPNAIDPLEELSSIMDCEDALVTPIERTSKTLH
jgi:cell pole-organizing protein PopZ